MGGSTSKQKDLTDYRHLGDDELIERVKNCKRVVISRTETHSKITGKIPKKFIDALRKDLEVL